MLVETSLILFGQACQDVAMVSKKWPSSEFAHDQGLVVLRDPIHRIRFLRATGIPTNVFIVPEHIEVARNRILDAHGYAVTLDDFVRLKSRRYQARGVGGMRILNELP